MKEEIKGSVNEQHADSTLKWKHLGDLALSKGHIDLAAECGENAKDFASLMLIYSSTNNYEGLQRVAVGARVGD